MRIRRLSRGEWVVAGLIALLLLLIAVPALMVRMWVGRTDLEVEFVMTDAVSGEPIPGATVEVHSEGGFYEEREPRDFRLVAGPDGRASYLCRNSMCCGTKGLFTDTYSVHLPWWWFRVSATGYEPTESAHLNVPEHVRAVRRVCPQRAKLVVSVPLRRKPA